MSNESSPVIEFRLTLLEKHMDENQKNLAGKLDTTIDKLNETITTLALVETRLRTLEETTKELTPLKDALANLNYKVKYQVAPGMFGGGLITASIEIIKLMVDKLWQ